MTDAEQLDRALASAEAAVAQLGADYGTRLRAQVEAIVALTADLRDGEPATVLARLQALAFELKGEAGSFGHVGISRVAASLCRLTERAPPRSTALISAIEAHAQALATLATSRAAGTHEATARAMVAALEALSDRLGGGA